MIRIIHMIGSLDLGGSQQLIMNLYEAIDRSKIQFDFILDEPKQTFLAEKVILMGGRVFFLPKFNGKNLFEVANAWNAFFQYHPEYRIIHSHVRSYAFIYFHVAKKYGVKTIIHSHSTSNGTGVKALAKAVLQYPLRYQADYFFGCSQAAGEWLFGKRVVNGSHYQVLQNAINIEAFCYAAENREIVRGQYGVQSDTIICGHVGRFHESKNHLFLLQLFAEYHKEVPNSILMLVGDGELRPRIVERIDRLGISSSVILTGMQSNIAQYLHAMDVFVFPSRWEGLPLSLVEAQAAGLQCFVSDTITREVNISPFIEYIPIHQGVEKWTSALKYCSMQRTDAQSYIRKAGYDIELLADKLTSFYYNIQRTQG